MPVLAAQTALAPVIAQVGFGTKVSTILSDAVEHPALPVTVIVKVTVPADRSAALGVYVGSSRVALLKVPLPLVVQDTVPFV